MTEDARADASIAKGNGPLNGVRIVEVAGIGPGPMCAMLLSDLGASVIRIERPGDVDLGTKQEREKNYVLRGRPYMSMDLKDPQAREQFLMLTAHADVLIEGFRPGVMERLGLGPDDCQRIHPGLIYGRMTGWGQDGPLSKCAGHDLNFLALTGALHSIGRAGQPPTPPLNLVADYGGGALYLAFGIVAALFERAASGKGQVVDCAITDGVTSMMTTFFGLHAAGLHGDRRGENILDSGAYFYDSYECSDGKFLAVGCIEERFHDQFLSLIGLAPADFPDRFNRQHWGERKALIARVIKARTRDEWSEVFLGTDACVSPVLNLSEALTNQHLMERGTFVSVDGKMQPAPAPRFSRTRCASPGSYGEAVTNASDVLAMWKEAPGAAAYQT